MLDCPVCPRRNIKGDTCPQCGANLGPLLRLAEVTGSYSREGVEHLTAGRIGEAISSLCAALALEGPSADLSLSLGKAYARKGMNAEALSQLDRGLQLEPNNEEIRKCREAVLLGEEQSDAEERSRREQQEARDRRRRRLMVVIPVAAFILGVAVLPAVQGLRRPRSVDLPTLALRVREALARQPSLSSFKPEVTVSGNTLQVVAEAPSAVYAELIEAVALRLADGHVAFAGIRTRPPASVVVVRYKVRHGDSFWSISRAKYRNPELWREIEKVNRGYLPKPGLLHPGDEIVLPPLTVMPK